MEVLVAASILGLIPGVIAHNKGKSFLVWWFYGAAIFIVALPHALLIQADKDYEEKQKLKEGMKKCPYCAELIKGEAVICRFCGKEI